MAGAALALSFVFVVSFLAVLLSWRLAKFVMKQDTGNASMQKTAEAIKKGGEAFLKRQYKTIGIFTFITAILLVGLYYYFGDVWVGVKTAFAFVIGATLSAVAGIVGMAISVRANLRTAAGAYKSMPEALTIALRGGAVSGFLVVALSLLGVAGIYVLFGANPQETPFHIVGFGFGASFVALFAQLGGGIYTKAADVGADLVGKVEAGIPEDDSRNPAVIADLVGDNVGDCAGRGADLFESTAAENIGAMILGVALFPVFGVSGVLFPLVARSFGLIASAIGIFSVKAKENENPMKALNRGYYLTVLLSIIGFYIAVKVMLDNVWFFWAGVTGIVLSLLFVYITQYYTEHRFRPVREIAEASKTGAATNIIAGVAIGFENTGLPVLSICLALFFSYLFGLMSGVPHGGLYGTAMATMGMLASAAYILAMDTFGPITDNAGGIVEMSNAPAKVRKRTDQLDSVGNTTKALTKGYAIGSAALAAFLLFSAYLDEVSKLTGKAFEVVNLAKVPVFIGGMLGAMLVFLFSAYAIRAVGKTAGYIIKEARRQFKKKGVMEGTVEPDYAACVDITTRGALRNMVLPSLLAIFFPIVVGLLLRAEAAAAFLMVGTIAGILLAIVLNNSGGAWDNAKKHVESGAHGGKGSDAHKAAVVGDTVGDPFKDTAGPSLHVLIKLLATVTLVMAPLFL
ncbi:sodium-translocating pyrophosphatase [Candidatus Woesearchaeota archaeon]|nr:sodium-translocating pyrophosphatase [Candidatus Woesearchaeota archaeon]